MRRRVQVAALWAIEASQKRRGFGWGGRVMEMSFGVQGRVERKNALAREALVPGERWIVWDRGNLKRWWRV